MAKIFRNFNFIMNMYTYKILLQKEQEGGFTVKGPTNYSIMQ